MKASYSILFAISLIFMIACESSDIKFSRSDVYMDSSVAETTGQGGSMARFTIVGERLYTVSDQNLTSFDISDPHNIVKKTSKQIDWWGVETIFPMGDKLFLGTTSGMHIMDISDPDNIYKVSSYEHVVSCDPVVAQGSYAYVTLNSSQERCGRDVNQLHVIDISNISNPINLKIYNMTSPKGLGIDGDLLFVCDANFLKVFDASDPLNLLQINAVQVNGTYDVIPYNDHLLLISDEGLKQYTYENGNLNYLSSIYTTN